MSSRLSDFLSTFDEVIDFALENDVHLALFCGDAYKSRDPSQTHQREFAKRIARLSTAGIPVFLLVGNHGMPNVVGRATALEIFRTLDVPSVITGDTLQDVTSCPTAEGPVQIVALPWIRRSAFLGRDDTRSLTPRSDYRGHPGAAHPGDQSPGRSRSTRPFRRSSQGTFRSAPR